MKINERYGRLVVLKLDRRTTKNAYYLCQCDCGTQKVVRSGHLGKSTNSCGCIKRDPRPRLRGRNSPNWKESPTYFAIHIDIVKAKGNPKHCKHCGKTTGKIEYANIDHKYTRNPDDYIPLCTSCHRIFDIKYNGYLTWTAKKRISQM